MHHNILLRGSILIMFLSVSAENIRLLERQEIDKKAIKIEKKLIRDKFFLSVLTVGGYIQSIYVFISLLTQYFADNSSTQSIHDTCPNCVKKVAEVVIPVTEIPMKQKWAGIIGQFIVYHGSMLGVSFILSRVADSLIHPDTLRWYIHAYVPYVSTIEDMKRVIFNLQDQFLDKKTIIYKRELLKGSLIRLARYGELICAYMAYKIKHLDAAEQEIALKTSAYLFDYYNDWLIDMNVLCEVDSLDYNRMNALIKLYEITITSQLRHFYAIEGETKIDCCAMEEVV